VYRRTPIVCPWKWERFTQQLLQIWHSLEQSGNKKFASRQNFIVSIYPKRHLLNRHSSTWHQQQQPTRYMDVNGSYRNNRQPFRQF